MIPTAVNGNVQMDVQGDMKEIVWDLRVLHPDLVRRAQVAAINKTARAIRGRTVKGIANSAGIKPQKLIRQRSRVSPAKFRRLRAIIRFYLDPMPAQAMKPKAPRGGGVTAASGTHVWPKGFKGTARAGRGKSKKSAWQRTGPRAYPIEKLKVPLEGKAPILAKVGNRLMVGRFKKTLDHELTYRLKKYAGRL